MPDHDSKFDEFLRREANRHMEPVTPPADAIWAAIEQDVARAIRPPVREATPIASRRLWITIGLGIAATLVIGVGLGRWSASRDTRPAVAVAAPHPSTDDSVRAATLAEATVVRYLAETEVFLTAVRADLKSGRRDVDRADRSRELLARTRLLLASGESRSPTVDLLLRDLELLLAEIAALPPDGRTMDERLIDERLRQGTIIPRIRTTLPAQSAGL